MNKKQDLEREVFKPSPLFHLCTPGQSQREVWVDIRLSFSGGCWKGRSQPLQFRRPKGVGGGDLYSYITIQQAVLMKNTDSCRAPGQNHSTQFSIKEF